jgi:hypothetical protein
MSNPTTCPICKAVAQEVARVGNATAFECVQHGTFKVADTIFALDAAKHASRAQWEAALAKAKRRSKSREWPLICRMIFCFD